MCVTCPFCHQKRFLYQRLSLFLQSWSWAARRLRQRRLPPTVKSHELKCGRRTGGLLHRRTVIIALQTFSVCTFPVSSKSPGLAELLIWFVRDDVNWFHSSVARLSTAGATLAGVCSEQNVRCIKKTAAVWSVSCTGVNCRGRQFYPNFCCSFFEKIKKNQN